MNQIKKQSIMKKETNYELIYTDNKGDRQVQDFIKTKEEALRRKRYFYNSKDTVVKKVVKTYEDGDCTDIEKTII